MQATKNGASKPRFSFVASVLGGTISFGAGLAIQFGVKWAFGVDIQAEVVGALGLNIAGDIIAALTLCLFGATAVQVLTRLGIVAAVAVAIVAAAITLPTASSLGPAVLGFLIVLLLFGLLFLGLIVLEAWEFNVLDEIETWTYAGPLFKSDLIDDEENNAEAGIFVLPDLPPGYGGTGAED